MGQSQPGILAGLSPLARYLTFSLIPGKKASDAIREVENLTDIENNVIGLGRSLVLAARSNINRLREFPHVTGAGIEIPSTPSALWMWLKGDDRGELVHRSRMLEHRLADYFQVVDVIDAFQYAEGRDMSGYIDGTENPTGEKAFDAAILQGQGEGMDGSSFVAVQQWLHDLDRFDAFSQKEKDHIIGRRLADNEELEDAPPTAHVKRTAQESFDPEAYIVRRSMPWAEEQSTGLVFVAFGKSFDAFEALLTRMVGLEDSVSDALFKFTQPVSGAYYWCPPVKDGRLDLSVIIGR